MTTNIATLEKRLEDASAEVAKHEQAKNTAKDLEAFRLASQALTDAEIARTFARKCLEAEQERRAAADLAKKRERLQVLAARTGYVPALKRVRPLAERFAKHMQIARAMLLELDSEIAELDADHLQAHDLAAELGVLDQHPQLRDRTTKYNHAAMLGSALCLQLLQRIEDKQPKAPRSPLFSPDLAKWTDIEQPSYVLQMIGATHSHAHAFKLADQLRAALQGTHSDEAAAYYAAERVQHERYLAENAPDALAARARSHIAST